MLAEPQIRINVAIGPKRRENYVHVTNRPQDVTIVMAFQGSRAVEEKGVNAIRMRK
jgi:hypothetical protein